ncbi:hypothetical protein DM02DRAFT_630834 [Periconia macrospinosa]|uniref:Uncharacterized protein n=1 Tax=Periconia macrospinosa TaxID=97972 RepID=A0A2V1DI25_9PLEO|nr:hypothetical protein DM02DRAFT_630834 [Periconia macrospinosa]
MKAGTSGCAWARGHEKPDKKCTLYKDKFLVGNGCHAAKYGMVPGKIRDTKTKTPEGQSSPVLGQKDTHEVGGKQADCDAYFEVRGYLILGTDPPLVTVHGKDSAAEREGCPKTDDGSHRVREFSAGALLEAAEYAIYSVRLKERRNTRTLGARLVAFDGSKEDDSDGKCTSMTMTKCSTTTKCAACPMTERGQEVNIWDLGEANAPTRTAKAHSRLRCCHRSDLLELRKTDGKTALIEDCVLAMKGRDQTVNRVVGTDPLSRAAGGILGNHNRPLIAGLFEKGKRLVNRGAAYRPEGQEN